MIDDASLNAALAQYRAQGYAVLPGVFDATEVAAMAASFDHHWAEGMRHRASFRHGNLLYRLGEDAARGKILRLVQWPSYVDAVLEAVRRDPHFLRMLAPRVGPASPQIR